MFSEGDHEDKVDQASIRTLLPPDKVCSPRLHKLSVHLMQGIYFLIMVDQNANVVSHQLYLFSLSNVTL